MIWHNPNGMYGAIDTFSKNTHCKYYSKAICKELQNLIQNNPSDIFMVIHASEGNTSSGYHAVMAVQGKVVSFNNEKIVPYDEYVKNIHNGYIFNVSKIAKDSAEETLRQEFKANIAEVVQNQPTTTQATLATIHYNPCFDCKYIVEQIKHNSRTS